MPKSIVTGKTVVTVHYGIFDMTRYLQLPYSPNLVTELREGFWVEKQDHEFVMVEHTDAVVSETGRYFFISPHRIFDIEVDTLVI